MSNQPDFFPDSEPEKPDFEPEISPDFDDEPCPICSIKFGDHSAKQIVECALMQIRHPKGGELH